jgi:glycosyltransferase involved in cell wall biosynthesis
MVAYNSEGYIYSAISSIMNQTYTNWELVIINDGSTDKTASIINMFHDKRILIYNNECNKGISYSRNKALSLSSGEYIAVLDSDDIAIKNRLENQVKYLQNDSNVSLVATSTAHIDEDSNIIYTPSSIDMNSELIHAHLLFANCIYHSSVMMRKCLLPANAYNIDCHVSEDFDLWVKLSRSTKLCFMSEIFTLYRVHTSSTSQSNNKIVSQYSISNVLNQTNAIGLTMSDQQFELWLNFLNFDILFTFSDLILLHSTIISINPACLSAINVDVQIFNNLTSSVFKRRIIGLFIVKEYNFSLLLKFFNSDLKPYKYYSRTGIFKMILKCLFMYKL